MIFIHHASPSEISVFYDIQESGWIGVDVFLCLSAFLLMRLLIIEYQQKGNISLLKFYLRRILRIWPLYFAYLVLIGAVSFFISGIGRDQIIRFITLATFTDNIATIFAGYNPLPATSHLWTISYEEQFYLVLPLVFMGMWKAPGRKVVVAVVILFVIGLLLRGTFIWQGFRHPGIWVFPFTHFESIAGGILMAYYYDACRNIPRWILVMAALLSMVTLTLTSLATGNLPELSVTYLAAGVLSFSVIQLAIAPQWKWVHSILMFKPFRYLGKVSYGLYIFHLICLSVVYQLRISDNNSIDTLAALAMTILCAIVSYELFEKRFLRMKNTQLRVVPPTDDQVS